MIEDIETRKTANSWSLNGLSAFIYFTAESQRTQRFSFFFNILLEEIISASSASRAQRAVNSVLFPAEGCLLYLSV